MISINLKKRIYTASILFFLVFLIFNSKIILTYFLIVFGILSIIEFLQITIKIFKTKISLILFNTFFSTYVFYFCLFFLFSYETQLKFVILTLLIGCVASDIGGYVFGKIFKGPRLTKISPNKTYAGFFGSLFLSLITISSLFFYFINVFNYKIVITALTTSVFCQAGDLIFSFLKRKAKIKDSGKILPGHGGILDRLDGIFIGTPAGFLTLLIIS